MTTWIAFFFCALGSGALCAAGALAVFFVHHGPTQALWGVLMAAMLGFGGGGSFGVALVRLGEALKARAQAKGGAASGLVAASHGLSMVVPALRALSGLGTVLFVLVVELVLLVTL